MFDLTSFANYCRYMHDTKELGYYDDHVTAVVNEVHRWTDDIPTIAAAHGHDLVEDTAAELWDILRYTDIETTNLIDNVTDAEGKNRKERKLQSYHKIRRSPKSVLIKLCDRLDNVRRCMRDPQKRFGEMYVKEHYTFQCALWVPNQYEQLWQEVNAMVDIIARRG